MGKSGKQIKEIEMKFSSLPLPKIALGLALLSLAVSIFAVNFLGQKLEEEREFSKILLDVNVSAGRDIALLQAACGDKCNDVEVTYRRVWEEGFKNLEDEQ